MILLGYHPTGAYKLYDPRQRKIVISRDIVVDEAKGWDWSRSESSSHDKTVTVNLETEPIEEAVAKPEVQPR